MRKEFASHDMDLDGHQKIRRLREMFSHLLDGLDAELVEVDGRAKALMITHLETACMFAVKSVAAKYPVNL